MSILFALCSRFGKERTGDRQETETDMANDTRTTPLKADNEKPAKTLAVETPAVETPVFKTPVFTPTLGIDWEFYQEYLKTSDLSETDKRALIETLWLVVMAFVDLGFGTHPVQQVGSPDCGQKQDLAKFIAADRAKMLHSKPSLTPYYTKSAAPFKGPLEGRDSQ